MNAVYNGVLFFNISLLRSIFISRYFEFLNTLSQLVIQIPKTKAVRHMLQRDHICPLTKKGVNNLMSTPLPNPKNTLNCDTLAFHITNVRSMRMVFFVLIVHLAEFGMFIFRSA
ncbi:hypothetical protein ASF92_08835 [Pedobacter sp. Leaf176]|nr:hypothetical protein ASF92_08835 [Pedobacter sp. Leaf176]